MPNFDSMVCDLNNSIVTSTTYAVAFSLLEISNGDMVFVVIFLCIVLHGGFSSIGVISNGFSLLVFKRQGLKDSMTVGLFSLSLSDFLACLFQLAISLCYIVALTIPDYIEDPHVIRIVVLAWPRYLFYLVSIWITALISLERCFCVTFPFQIRRIFTKFRYVIIVILIFAFNIVFHIPLCTSQQIVWKAISVADGNGNTTRRQSVMDIKRLDNTIEIEFFTDIGDLSLSALFQIIIIICSFWMIKALKLSTSVRAGYSFSKSDTINTQKLPQSHSFLSASLREGHNLSDRERKLVRVVAVLAIYLTLCNIPHFVSVTVYHVWFKHIKNDKTNNFEKIMWRISDLSHIICASLNFVVHLWLNSNYKTNLRKMFG